MQLALFASSEPEPEPEPEPKPEMAYTHPSSEERSFESSFRHRLYVLKHRGAPLDERLREALLLRGFLVARRPNGGLYLPTSSHRGDVETLGQWLELRPSADKDVLVDVVVPDQHGLVRVVRNLLALRTHRGFVASGHPVGAGWDAYRAMRFGAWVDVAGVSGQGRLDPGIALLVKVLPLVGVGTTHSCDGHGVRPASIGLHRVWDAPWLDVVLRHLWEVHSVPRPLCGWRVHQDALTIDAPSFGALVDDVQGVARTLLEPNVHAPLREARWRALAAVPEAEAPTPAAWRERLHEALQEA